MKIVFDSNVWRKIFIPSNFPKDPDKELYISIRKHIDQKRIEPYLCETVFALEAYKKTDRKTIFKVYKPHVDVQTNMQFDGTMVFTFTMGPGKTNQPELNDFLREHLSDAIAAGFKIIHLPRIAGFVNQEVEPYRHKLVDQELQEYLCTVFNVGRRIDERVAGHDWIEKIGAKYNNENPFEGVGQAPDSQNGLIAKAVAELADGDSLACTVAIKADYFFTNDIAKGSGDKSAMSTKNSSILEKEFGLRIISPV